MLKRWMTICLCLIATFSLFSCKSLSPSSLESLKKNEEGFVVFEEALSTDQFLIVKMGLDNCVGCEIANDVFKILSPQYPEVYFSKVDIMQNRQAITDYKITQVPTIIFFDQNKEQVYRIEDIIDEEMMLKAMKDLAFIKGK